MVLGSTAVCARVARQLREAAAVVRVVFVRVVRVPPASLPIAPLAQLVPEAELLGRRKRHQALLEVGKRALHEGLPVAAVRNERVPQRLRREHLRISQHHRAVLGACEGHVETARVIKKAHTVVFVATHAAEYDVVLLSSLEGIHARNLDLLVQHLAQRTRPQQRGNHVRALPLVRRDHAQLRWVHAAAQKGRDDALDIGGLHTIEIRRATARYFFLAHLRVEHKRALDRWPREVHLLAHTLAGPHAVLQATFVERVGRELGERRVHAVLDLEPDRADAHADAALEERLVEPRARGLLANDDRPELAVITDKHCLLGTRYERDEALRLGGLRVLIDEHVAETEVGQPRVACAHACAAYHISGLQHLALGRFQQRAILFFVLLAELAGLHFELAELSQLLARA
mmetsp:Transcript_9039/g.36954  ORF Transcript_9039/g.36954 Transcript_9039/m.36954 type:complete len:402 (-) Transcript_9039:474-1679(-)